MQKVWAFVDQAHAPPVRRRVRRLLDCALGLAVAATGLAPVAAVRPALGATAVLNEWSANPAKSRSKYHGDTTSGDSAAFNRSRIKSRSGLGVAMPCQSP